MMLVMQVLMRRLRLRPWKMNLDEMMWARMYKVHQAFLSSICSGHWTMYDVNIEYLFVIAISVIVLAESLNNDTIQIMIFDTSILS